MSGGTLLIKDGLCLMPNIGAPPRVMSAPCDSNGSVDDSLWDMVDGTHPRHIRSGNWLTEEWWNCDKNEKVWMSPTYGPKPIDKSRMEMRQGRLCCESVSPSSAGQVCIRPGGGSDLRLYDTHWTDEAPAAQFGPWTMMSNEEHLARCCSGAESSATICGDRRPGRTACDTYMSDKCSRVVQSQAGSVPVLMVDPKCKSWCAANPGACDAIKTGFCASNITSPYCVCWRTGIDPSSNAALQKVLTDYPELRDLPFPFPCFAESKCSLSDLNNQLIPQQYIDQLKTGCASELILQRQNIDLTGSTVIGSTIGSQTANGSGGTAVDTWSKTTILAIFISLFMILLIVIGIIIAARSAKKQRRRRRQLQPRSQHTT